MSWTEFIWEIVANVVGSGLWIALFTIGGLLVLRGQSLIKKIKEGKTTVAPDGVRRVHEYGGELYLADAAGNIKNLTRSRALDFGPQWSPDGKLIAFTSQDFGGVNIRVVNVQNGKGVQLQTTTTVPRPPQWEENNDLKVDLGGSYIIIKRSEIERKLA